MLRKYLNYHYIFLLKNFILFLLVIFLCITILIMPQSSANGVKNGLNSCINILIPSLFPFMVLSSFIVKCGISEYIGKLISPITKTIFKLPGYTGIVILLGLIGGYPTGAIGINELYSQKKISQKQAEQMLLFTVGAGPAFVINAIGNQLYNNKFIGVLIFISQIISSTILGILIGLCFNNTNKETEHLTITKSPSLSCALVESCLVSARAMFNMCAFVILFSALLNILKETSIISIISNYISSLNIAPSISNSIFPITLEVTNGCISCINNHAPIELTAFTLGWAGLCVHFQIFSITETIKFSKAKFIICRFLHGALSSIIVHFLLILFSSNTCSPTIKLIYSSDKSYCYFSKGSIALILLCIYFLFSVTSKTTNFKNKQGFWGRHKIEEIKKRRYKRNYKK